MGAQQTPNPGMSGYSDTGDGIYIEANYDYEIQLTIDESDSGQQSVISSDNGYALQVFEPDADKPIGIVSALLKIENIKRQSLILL